MNCQETTPQLTTTPIGFYRALPTLFALLSTKQIKALLGIYTLKMSRFKYWALFVLNSPILDISKI